MHKIIPGSASKSYGVHVAKKAGIPAQIIELANEILNDLEDNHKKIDVDVNNYQLKQQPLFVVPEWIDEFRQLDVEEMTMREMANALIDFVEKANSNN